MDHASGGVKVRTLLREDPIKLVQETIRRQYPEAPFADKAFFSFHLLHTRLNKVLKGMPQLPEKERKFWLLKLEKDYKSLERQLEKSHLGLDVNETMRVFESNFKKLHEAVERIGKSNLEAQTDSVKKLDKIKTEEFKVGINPDLITAFDDSSAKDVQRLTDIDYLNLHNLSNAFGAVSRGSHAEIQHLQKSLETLTKRIDDLIDLKQYESAITLYRTIMPMVPDPGRPFWNELKNVSALGGIPELRQRSDQVKGISDSLGKLSLYFWESKFKTTDLLLKPDEWIYMLNTEAALRKSINGIGI